MPLRCHTLAPGKPYGQTDGGGDGWLTRWKARLEDGSSLVGATCPCVEGMDHLKLTLHTANPKLHVHCPAGLLHHHCNGKQLLAKFGTQ
eukprot:scaffold69897_cov21-Prasinocladus_malaysianus.AAC.1